MARKASRTADKAKASRTPDGIMVAADRARISQRGGTDEYAGVAAKQFKVLTCKPPESS